MSARSFGAMRWVLAASLGLVSAAALLTAAGLHVRWESVATAALVIACLVWLLVVLTLPWNLHFKAKAVLFEMQRARERGLAERKDREEEARGVARRMLRISVLLHVASAALAAGGAWLSGAHWAYVFSGAYLFSGLFRPGVAWYVYLRTRLGIIGSEASFPPDDVKSLKAEVARVCAMACAAVDAEKKLREKVEQRDKANDARHKDLERRFTLLARKFEETIDRLTDNQQIISGIKAFLRLIDKGDATKEAAAP
jgi:hypothetical protein